MTPRDPKGSIRAVSVSAIQRNDRQTGQRLKAAPSTALTLPNQRARAEILDQLTGSQGALTIYSRELASIRHQAAALRLKNRALLEQVRALQIRPTTRTKVTQR
jgi:hypothetical protein